MTREGTAEPKDWFVGDYGRIRTVTGRPERQPLGHHQQPGRPRRAGLPQDDRILEVAVPD